MSAGYDRSPFGDDFRSSVMPDMLTLFGISVTYQRGTDTVEISGILGDAIFANDDATGVDVQLGDASFEFVADQLDFGSGPIVPKKQDQIISSLGDVYIVVEAGLLDSEDMMWTIPVKKSEYKEP